VQDLLVEMFEVIQKEASLYRKLLMLFKKQRDTLVAAETDVLAECVEQGEMLASEIEAAELSKKSLEEKVACLLDVPIDQLNLSLLKKASEGPLREKYTRLEAELSSLLTEFRSVITTNATLAQESLDYIHFVINTLTGAENLSPTYSEGGALKDEGRTRLFDKRL